MKTINKLIGLFLCVTMLCAGLPYKTYAEEAVFTALEIHAGSLNGEKVVDLLNPTGAWSLKTGTDYYLSGSFTKNTGSDYLRIRFGNSDGTFNGVTFFNPPGGTYTEGSIEHDYFDSLTRFISYENPGYGSSTARLALQDGEMIYHIKSSVATGSSVNFAMGMIIDDAVFSGVASLPEAIQVATGSYTNSEFTVAASETKTLNMSEKGSMQIYYSTTSLTATLDGNGGTVQLYVNDINKDSPVSLLYDKLEFDINYPERATLVGASFSSTNLSLLTHSTYGTITQSLPVTNDGISTVHVTVSNGYRVKATTESLFFRLNFSSDYFSDGNTCKTNISNAVMTAKDGTVYDIRDTSSSVTYTILDASKDYTTLSAVNRSAVYNHTADGVENYISNLGSSSIINRSVSEPTPFEKTYEASFNTTETAANISLITVPLGTSTTPNITISGYDALGNAVTQTIATPATYGNVKNNISSSTYLILPASAFGMQTITNVKADIGCLRASYKSCSWASSWSFGNNLSAAYGSFTTAETGIQVKNTFRLYNTNPSYRDLPAGDLVVSTTATSTLNGNIGYYGSVSTIKNSENKTTDSVAAGETVSISGNVIPYYVPGAEKQGTAIGNTTFLFDPIIYLTLPKGLTYESFSFRVGASSASAKAMAVTIENISYLNTSGDGTSLYKVRFPADTFLGYYSQTGGVCYLYYDIKLKTSKSMETKRYEINDLIGISTDYNITALPYSGNPATLNTIVTDTYGINDGRNYAGITRGTSTNQPGFGLQQMAEINIYNAVSVTTINGSNVVQEWHTYDSSDPNSIASLGRNSSGQFRLNIENTSDTVATALKIAVPIPKKGQDLGNVFMDGSSQFDMNFTFNESDFTSAGFTASYVTLTAMDTQGVEFVTTPATAATANAILLSCDTVPASATYTFYLNFTVTDGEANMNNIWRNSFHYTTSDATIQYKPGSYVASSVAAGNVHGTVFNDTNRNGVKNAGEVGVSGVTVIARDSSGKILSDVTDSNGIYNFLSIRETDVTLTFSISSAETLRFNVSETEGSDVLALPSTDGLTAIATIYAAETNIVNAALSGYYSVSYNRNAASGDAPAGHEYVAGANATVEVKPDNLQRTGYNFVEWNTLANGSGTGYQPGETFTVNSNTTLYAIWAIGTYSIYFNYRGATGGNTISEKLLTHNKTYNTGGTLPTPTKQGYSFVGWCNNSVGTTANVTNTTRFALGTDTTLYAIWKAKTGYTVTYNNNGGTGQTSRLVSWNDTILPSSNPVRAGYTLAYFSDGNGNRVSSSTLYNSLAISDNISDTVTLTALWTANGGYTVSYNVNSGTGTYVDKSVNWNSADLLPLSNPSRDGFAFKGWTYAGETVVATDSYEELAKDANINTITLTASWIELSDNTVHYVTNGGTVYQDKTGVKSSDKNLIPANNPVRAGYRFVGWTYTFTGRTVNSDTVYSDLTAATSVTLSAEWQMAQYSVSYNYGSYGIAMKYWTDSGLIPTPEPTKDGSTFAGWYYGAVEVTNTTTIANLIPQDNVTALTLTASWSEHSYTVVYNSDGGTYYSPKTNVTYSSVGLLPDATPIRTGYTFNGWYCNDTLVTNSTICNSLISGESNSIVLKASWVAKTGYRVIYNTTGGSYIETKSDVKWTDVGLLPDQTPVRVNYSFGGWVSGRHNVTGTTAYSTLASSDAAGSAVTLVAQWNIGNYTVHYDTAGGTSVADKMVLWESSNLLPGQNIVKHGYKLVGWKYLDTDVTAETQYSALVVDNAITEITLIAQYIVEEETENTGLRTEGYDVQGRVLKEQIASVYKIDLSWGNMRFEFNTSSAWNPSTHQMEQGIQGSWSPTSFDGSNNKIIVSNHSNANLQIDITVQREVILEENESNGVSDVLNGINMAVMKNNREDSEAALGMLLEKVPAENASAPSIFAYLWLTGEPDNMSFLSGTSFTKIGTITVTFRATGGELTPKNEG